MTARTVVVAGGSRGIGGEVATRLAARGDRVVVGCREKAARARRLSAQSVAAGGRPLDVRVGDLRVAAVRRHLLSGLDPIDVLVLAASGGMEAGSSDSDAFALNRDALVSLVDDALPRMADGGVVVYLTSHQAHFSREVVPEAEYARVAASKRAGEDALGALGERLAAVGARLTIVSADVVSDSATTLLMERLRPGSTDERRRQIGTLPTTAEVAATVVDVIDRPRPHGAVVFHGGARWFRDRGARGCPRLGTIDGESSCAAGAVERIRAHLARGGLRATDRVLVCDESTPETALVLLALMSTGVSVVLLDPGLPVGEVAGIAARTGCTAAVSSTPLPSTAGRVDLGPAAGLAVSVVTGSRPGGGCGRGCGSGFASGSDPGVGPARGDLGLGAWADRDDALILWTSGSSGRPRGVVRSGASVIENVRATADAMRYHPDDVLLPLLPISHQYGLSLLLAWWLVGCTLVLGSHRRPTRTLRAARALGVTVVDAAPPVYEDLLAEWDERGPDAIPPTVRMWCVGGSPLRPSLAARFRRVTGHVLLDGYGSTELGNVSLATLDRSEGLGRVLPGVELSVRRPTGETAGIGETGELWIRSTYAFTATIDDTRPTEIGDGWYRTGDLGSVSAEGVPRVIGRAGAVHRGGFTIYAGDIEDRADAAGIAVTIVALDDERRGAHLTAFVHDDGARTRADWADRLRSVLPEHQWPNRVVVVSALPRLGNGKVDRARLVALAREGRPAATQRAGRPVSTEGAFADAGS